MIFGLRLYYQEYSRKKVRRAFALLAFLFSFVFFLPPAHGYSFQYQTVLMLDFYSGLSNFATPDQPQAPNKSGKFAFSFVPGLLRGSLMPEFRASARLFLRNDYLLQLQVRLDRLRNQQTLFAFGLGNESVGLLFGLAQEYTLASRSRSGKLGLGLYTKAFYQAPGQLDLQFRGTVLTNSFGSSSNAYQNVDVYFQSVLLLSQFRLGLVGRLNLFNAASEFTLVQAQASLVLGGSAPSRLFLLNFYPSFVVIANQGQLNSNYIILLLGLGLHFQFALYKRFMLGLFIEVMPLAIPIEKVNNTDKKKPGLTIGLNLHSRISRKELWSPVPRKSR